MWSVDHRKLSSWNPSNSRESRSFSINTAPERDLFSIFLVPARRDINYGECYSRYCDTSAYFSGVA